MREKRALHFGPQFDRPVGKSHRKPKKVGAGKTYRNKADDPTPSEVAQCGSHTVNTMCFEGSDQIRMSGFGVTLSLGWDLVWGHFFMIFGPGRYPKQRSLLRSSKKRQKERNLPSVITFNPKPPGPGNLVIYKYIYIYIY